MAVRVLRVCGAAAVALAAAAPALSQVRILQTNSGASNNISVIDPASNRVVAEVAGVPINHGAAASPDGRQFYFSSEAEQTLHVVDGKTLQTTKKIPLSGRPNNISINKRRLARVRRHRLGPRRGGRDRHEVAREGEVDSDQGRHPQRLRHARRQLRGGRFDRRPR